MPSALGERTAASFCVEYSVRPKPVELVETGSDPNFVKDLGTGLTWHRTSGRVLYADTDCSGAVYHSNHLRYFEMGRAALMRDARHPYREVEEAGYVYPVIKTGVNYYQFLTYDDLIWILTRPAHLERVRVRFDYVILKDGNPRIIADGFTQHCALNSKRIPVALDPATKEIWRNFPK